MIKVNSVNQFKNEALSNINYQIVCLINFHLYIFSLT